jgi:hypothetical protein
MNIFFRNNLLEENCINKRSEHYIKWQVFVKKQEGFFFIQKKIVIIILFIIEKISQTYSPWPKQYYVAEGMHELLTKNWHGNAFKCVWYSLEYGVKSVVLWEHLNIITSIQIIINFPNKTMFDKELLGFAKTGWLDNKIAVWVHSPNYYCTQKGIIFFGNFYLKNITTINNKWIVVLYHVKPDVTKRQMYKKMYNLYATKNKQIK